VRVAMCGWKEMVGGIDAAAAALRVVGGCGLGWMLLLLRRAGRSRWDVSLLADGGSGVLLFLVGHGGCGSAW
jgi:hypothetical protein